MAVEARRGCGYRKIGGLYMVGGGIGIPCDRLPLLLDVCPTCSHGIKPSLGWTWVDVNALVQGRHILNLQQVINEARVIDDTPDQYCDCGCPFCDRPEKMGRAGLIWIGEGFYKTPEEFIAEGVSQGFSRRLRSVPRGFKAGETYVLLAHRKTVPVPNKEKTGMDFKPGVFYIWLPSRLEKILPESARGSEDAQDLEKRGITPVFVPDDDPDHQGSVWEDKKKGMFDKEEDNDLG